MNFEMYASKELLTRYLNYYVDEIERIQNDREKRVVSLVNYEFRPILDIVYAHLVCNGMDGDKAYEEVESADKVNQQLNECLRSKPYTEEELNHIYCYEGLDFDKPYLEIAIKRFLYQLYGTKDDKKIAESMEQERKETSTSKEFYQVALEILKQKFETKKEVENKIHQKFDEWFLKEFNCGGYALEVFDWVSCESQNHDMTVSRILENPSVRLIGDTRLKEDEYLVVLDATSYHFIKQKDGKFVEKMRRTFDE